MKKQYYPGLLPRLKALFIDVFVIVSFMIVFFYLFSFFENVPDLFRIMAFGFVFFFYDPIFISFFGGTIGHMLIGIRVKRGSNENQNILFPFAIIRFAVKSLLGWVSFITIYHSKRRKAIHDFVIGSVVVYKE